MDPKQELCLGALFDIAATNVSNHHQITLSDYINPLCNLSNAVPTYVDCSNMSIQGLDMGRRLCIFGFCRSIEMLSDVVEDTVLEHGGEVCQIIHVLENLMT